MVSEHGVRITPPELMRADYQFTYVNDPTRLAALAESLPGASALALDIETASW